MQDFVRIIKGTGRVDTLDKLIGKNQKKRKMHKERFDEIEFCMNCTKKHCEGTCREFEQAFGADR